MKTTIKIAILLVLLLLTIRGIAETLSEVQCIVSIGFFLAISYLSLMISAITDTHASLRNGAIASGLSLMIMLSVSTDIADSTTTIKIAIIALVIYTFYRAIVVYRIAITKGRGYWIPKNRPDDYDKKRFNKRY